MILLIPLHGVIFQARVVQKVENAIQGIAWFVLWTLVHWIRIYPADSVILPFYNWDQNCSSSCKLFIVIVCEIRHLCWRVMLTPASCIWEVYMNAFRFSFHLWHSLKRCKCWIDNCNCPIVNTIVTNTRFSSSPSTKLFGVSHLLLQQLWERNTSHRLYGKIETLTKHVHMRRLCSSFLPFC